ncbi:MAG: rhodanese-like domain-containing protein [Sulfuricurvum sp.]|uniref:rhodanese-like domain-containing protein n=1 Tax=Sulfuricurvum sp. TaxID=2025608 RepID=UPI00260E6D11|nr:rhodanese-like domain-containing protein [Sulfuricurvum sp.]MDD2829376.1 rhodanese-like domain-containing protein [Sulfuricurvum sp.]MDD4949133.1 rhodanese-like domain-containing protein [Sulfuricurvum sp.]
MKQWLLLLTLLTSSLMAEYTAQPIDQKILDSKIKIIDIRTPGEWKTTGLVKGSIPIMFFDEKGNYDLNAFITQLNKTIKKGEHFALICNSGNRSRTLGEHLGNKMGYSVLDLQGGIQYAISKKIPIEPYRP